MHIVCLDEMLPKESLARVIDELINATDLFTLGFDKRGAKRTGRRAYATPVLLKNIGIYQASQFDFSRTAVRGHEDIK